MIDTGKWKRAKNAQKLCQSTLGTNLVVTHSRKGIPICKSCVHPLNLFLWQGRYSYANYSVSRNSRYVQFFKKIIIPALEFWEHISELTVISCCIPHTTLAISLPRGWGGGTHNISSSVEFWPHTWPSFRLFLSPLGSLEETRTRKFKLTLFSRCLKSLGWTLQLTAVCFVSLEQTTLGKSLPKDKPLGLHNRLY